MSIWVWAICGLGVVVCLTKATQLWKVVRGSRKDIIPGPDQPGEARPSNAKSDWPSVLVVIPARNEQTDLPTCLNAVLAQDYANMSVLVVDDRSEDRTNEIAREYAARDSRLRVERVRMLPAGWTGKAHAMWQGAQGATAEWLLFVDADVQLDPWAVRRAIEEMRSRNVELMTLWPRATPSGFWLQLCMPLLGAILCLWFQNDRVNDPDDPTGFVNGQFLLVTREAYERIGGHRAVRDKIIEDVPFGQLAKRSGVRCRLAVGTEIVQVRMYQTAWTMIDGWARIYLGAAQSRGPMVGTIAGLLIGAWSLVALVALPVLYGSVPAPGAAPVLSQMEFLLLGGIALADITVSLLLYAKLWTLARASRWWILLYPMSVGVTVFVLARAWWWLTTGRVVTWRGTSYQIDRVGRIVPQPLVERA